LRMRIRAWGPLLGAVRIKVQRGALERRGRHPRWEGGDRQAHCGPCS
jgi:hypothetical protein